MHGDLNGDGLTDTGDLTAMVNYFKAPDTISLGSLSANQQLWLDANSDGSYANAGDVLYAARAYAGSTAYPVFGALACPARASDELVVTATSYSAGQAALGAVAVAVEVAYSEAVSAWQLSSGAALSAVSPPDSATHYFSLAEDGGGGRELRLAPQGGWAEGATISLAYVVGDYTDAEKRAIFVQSSLAGQSRVALQSCTLGFNQPGLPPSHVDPRIAVRRPFGRRPADAPCPVGRGRVTYYKTVPEAAFVLAQHGFLGRDSLRFVVLATRREMSLLRVTRDEAVLGRLRRRGQRALSYDELVHEDLNKCEALLNTDRFWVDEGGGSDGGGGDGDAGVARAVAMAELPAAAKVPATVRMSRSARERARRAVLFKEAALRDVPDGT